MKPSFQLISALRRAADHIEQSPLDYEWCDAQRCNCGQVAQQLVGLEALGNLMYGHGETGTWRERAFNGYCQVTGEPVWQVIKALAAFGFERHDFEDIEFLRGNVVVQRVGYTLVKDDPKHVVLYLRAQADLLEEQLTPPAQKQAVEHGCSHLFLAGCCIYCSHVEQPLTAVNSTD